MTFLWPEMLWLLLIVPALVAAYFFLLRRKKQAALRYASLSMVKEAMGAGQKFRRHIPPLLFLGCAHRDDRRHCPSRRGCHLAVATPNDHPRHGRLRQHARHRRAAQSNFRGAGRRKGLCRRAALKRAHRRGVLRRERRRSCRCPRKIARTSLRRSIGSNCNAAPRSAAASSSPWRRSSPTQASM